MIGMRWKGYVLNVSFWSFYDVFGLHGHELDVFVTGSTFRLCWALRYCDNCFPRVLTPQSTSSSSSQFSSSRKVLHLYLNLSVRMGYSGRQVVVTPIAEQNTWSSGVICLCSQQVMIASVTVNAILIGDRTPRATSEHPGAFWLAHWPFKKCDTISSWVNKESLDSVPWAVKNMCISKLVSLEHEFNLHNTRLTSIESLSTSSLSTKAQAWVKITASRKCSYHC